MPIKANGVEGSLSRFARGKYSFCGAIAEQKGRFSPKQPVGLDLYKQPKRSYLRIPFLFLLTINIIQSR